MSVHGSSPRPQTWRERRVLWIRVKRSCQRIKSPIRPPAVGPGQTQLSLLKEPPESFTIVDRRPLWKTKKKKQHNPEGHVLICSSRSSKSCKNSIKRIEPGHKVKVTGRSSNKWPKKKPKKNASVFKLKGSETLHSRRNAGYQQLEAVRGWIHAKIMAIKRDHQAKYFIKEQAKVITSSSHPHSNNYYAGWNIQCEFPWSNNEAFNYCGSSRSEGEQCIISISAHTSDHPACSLPKTAVADWQPRLSSTHLEVKGIKHRSLTPIPATN